MSIAEHVGRIGHDGKYRYDLKPRTFALVPPVENKPLLKFLEWRLRQGLEEKKNVVLEASPEIDTPLPDTANAVIGFTDTPLEKRPPMEFFGRFQDRELRRKNKAVEVAVVPDFPQSNKDGALFMRQIMGQRGAHVAIAHEGNVMDSELRAGSRGRVGSMEGNVGERKYDPLHPEVIFDNFAQRLMLIAGAEMVDKYEGEPSETLDHETWVRQPEVQAIRQASIDLGKARLLWELGGQYGSNERTVFADADQMRRILTILRKNGLGEGNLSTLIRPNAQNGLKSPVMAITETGVSKTDIHPEEGQVVPVVGIKEYGAVYWKLPGAPGDKEHPPSVETHENAAFFHMASLIHARDIRSFEDILLYMDKHLKNPDSRLPIIPDGYPVAVDALEHLHVIAKKQQRAKNIKVVNLTRKELPFPHSPSCGSREGFINLLMLLVKSYEEYGDPESDEEVRFGNLRGHGLYGFGYKGMQHLTRETIQKAEFLPSVPRF